MASNQSHLRVLLTLVSAVVLALMVYINIHAMRHDVASDISHGGFLRLLERSIDYSGGGEDSDSFRGGVPLKYDVPSSSIVKDPLSNSDGKIKSDSENDEVARVDKLEEAVNSLKMLSDGVENQLHSLVDIMKQKSTKKKGNANDNNNMDANEPIDGEENEQPTMQEQQQSDKNLTGLNILLLYADDWTHHTLSSFHNAQPLNTILKTPILDALASDGIRFTHSCVTTSVCTIFWTIN